MVLQLMLFLLTIVGIADRYLGCIAQLVERWSPKSDVEGSSPSTPAKKVKEIP